MENSVNSQLLERLKKADEVAFKQLYDLFFHALCAFGNRFIQEDEQVADIVQEVFIKVWNLRQKFDSIYALRSFMYISVRNACLNYKRDSSKVIKISLSDELSEDDWKEATCVIIEEEVHRMIQDAINQLPPATKQVFNKPNYYVTFPSTLTPIQEFPGGDLITEKTKYWLFKQRDYMFFTSGVNNDLLYYYDTSRGTIHLYKDFNGKEITAMHPNKGFTDLGVGFADGTFKIFDVSEAVFISGQPKEIYSVDGIGKIVDVIYRYNKTGDHWK